MSEKDIPSHRNDYPYIINISTRWMDNDVYAHVNNVVYYSWFDTVVNQFLLENDVLDLTGGNEIGLVVETKCTYISPISFPDNVAAGLVVSHIGKSSVRYDVGIFRNDETRVSARGYFVHVYVDSKTRKSSPIPDTLKNVLESITRK